MRTHKRIPKENDLLIEEVRYTGDIDNQTEVHVIHYNETGWHERQLKTGELPEITHPHEVTWIRVNGLLNTEWIKQLTTAVQIPQMGLQDILQPQIIPRIEAYDDLIQCSMKYHIFHEDSKIETEQITIILGRGFVLSFQETDNLIFKDIFEAIQHNTAHLRIRSVDYLFLLLLNHILSLYVNQMNKLEETYETMENELLDTYNMDDNFRLRLKLERRSYQILKQSINPLNDGFSKIKENDDGLISKKNSIYVNVVYEQIKYLRQSLEVCRESFDSLVNLYISNNDLRMNEIMKRLTVITAIFIPLTFLVGVWGMNYEHMPELKLQYGYLLAWLIMIFVAAASWLFMRKRKWY